MDGTLVDTEPYWIETEYALAERHGGTWSDEHALNLVGNDLLDSGRYIREHMGIDLEPDQIVEELLDGVVARVEQEVPWCPGAVELLAALGAADVPCALVTMSYRRFVAPVLAALPPETFRDHRHRRRGQPGQAAPGAVPHRGRGCSAWTRPTAWPSRTPTPAPGRPRPPGAPCWSCRTTCRCCRGSGGSSATRLVGTHPGNLPERAR